MLISLFQSKCLENHSDFMISMGEKKVFYDNYLFPFFYKHAIIISETGKDDTMFILLAGGLLVVIIAVVVAVVASVVSAVAADQDVED